MEGEVAAQSLGSVAVGWGAGHKREKKTYLEGDDGVCFGYKTLEKERSGQEEKGSKEEEGGQDYYT